LALQPAVGFGLSKNTSPFFPIFLQLSPSSHSQHLKISFYFFSPSFPGSSSSTDSHVINQKYQKAGPRSRHGHILVTRPVYRRG
jgi:hypothetical protein